MSREQAGLRARRLLRLASRYRALVAGALTAAAVATALPVLAPPSSSGATVVAAARDLAAGTTLRAEDLTTVRLPDSVRPAGVLDNPAALPGRVLAGPVRRGEALTDVRLVGEGLLSQFGSSTVAAPVRLADRGSAALLRAGYRIDVLAADPQGGLAATVAASDVTVLAVPDLEDDAGEGALVVVGAPSWTAARLAAAATGARLSAVVRPARAS